MPDVPGFKPAIKPEIDLRELTRLKKAKEQRLLDKRKEQAALKAYKERVESQLDL